MIILDLPKEQKCVHTGCFLTFEYTQAEFIFQVNVLYLGLKNVRYKKNTFEHQISFQSRCAVKMVYHDQKLFEHITDGIFQNLWPVS